MGANREKEIIVALVRRLKDLRIKKGFSHNALAKKAGISRPSISFMENGKRTPTFLLCLKIANALDVRLSTLVQKCEREVDKKHSKIK